MAKFKLSGIGITALAGKIGGQVFQRNGSGFIVKNNATPPFRNNQFNGFQRTAFANLVKGWRTLSPAAQLSWNTIAPSYPRVNSFGDTYYLSGFNLYCSSNINLHTIGIPAAVSAPPAPTAQPVFDFSFATSGGSTFPTIILADLQLQLSAASWYYVVEMSPILSGGQFNNQNKTRLMFYASPCFQRITTDTNYNPPLTVPATFIDTTTGATGNIGIVDGIPGANILYITSVHGTVNNGDNISVYENGNLNSSGLITSSLNPQIQIGGYYDLSSRIGQRPLTHWQSLYSRYGQTIAPDEQLVCKVSMINMVTGVQTAPLIKTFTSP